jgi:DNA topoisomerase-1
LACSNYPQCKNTKKILINGEGKVEVAQDEESSETCEKCGARMVIKTGRFGKFLACSNYPACKNTKKIAPSGGGAEAAQSTLTGENCEQCGSPLVYRRGRFGQFIACSNYPKCRFTKKVTPPIQEERQTPEEKGQSAQRKKVYKKKKI